MTIQNNSVENELRALTQFVIVLTVVVFSVVFIVLNIVMDWEKWPIPLVAVAALACLIMHFIRKPSEERRLTICVIVLLTELFYYCANTESVYYSTPVITMTLIILTLTQERIAVMACFAVGLSGVTWNVVTSHAAGRLVFDLSHMVRIAWHLSLLFVAVIISTWFLSVLKRLGKRFEEYDRMIDESDRRTGVFLKNVAGVAAAGKMRERSEDMADMARLYEKRIKAYPSDFRVSEFISELARELYDAKPGELELILDMHSDIPAVINSDRGLLRKIIKHLVNNSYEYTEDGGVNLHLSTEKNETGSNFVIEVDDTGVGMDEEELERIYERFYRGVSDNSKKTEGLGIGMVLVNAFTDALGGFITIKSKKGKGTSVRVTIPVEVKENVSCADISGTDEMVLCGYLKYDRLPHPVVREYYNDLIRHMTKGFNLKMIRVDDPDDLKNVVKERQLTHVFISGDIYERDRDYFEGISDKLTVVAVVDKGFDPGENSKLVILQKPFYCLSLADILSGQKEEKTEPGQEKRTKEKEDIGADLLKENEAAKEPEEETRPEEESQPEEEKQAKEEKKKEKDRDKGFRDIYAPLREYNINVEEGIEFCNGDRALYRDVLIDIAEESGELLADLDEAVEEGNTETYRIIIHTLKGNGATIGARDIKEMASELEEWAENGDVEEIKKHHNRFVRKYENLVDLIDGIF